MKPIIEGMGMGALLGLGMGACFMWGAVVALWWVGC